jgi:hypothetical protein
MLTLVVSLALAAAPSALPAADGQNDPSGIANDPLTDPDPGMGLPPSITSGQASAQSATTAPLAPTSPDMVVGDGGGSYTNTSAEATYAKNWAYSYNGSYVHFSNDCTNFVSQALRAGGWTFVYPTYGRNATDSSQWFYINDGAAAPWSYSWDSAVSMMRFIQKSNRGFWFTNWKTSRTGDVFLVDWDSSHGYPTHAMVETANSLPAQVYMSQHTTARLNKPFTNYTSAYPNARWWMFHPY